MLQNPTTLNGVEYVLCVHSVVMWDILQSEDVTGKQIINPSVAYTAATGAIAEQSVFVNQTSGAIFSLGYLIQAWWRTAGNGLWNRISCQHGLLSPFDDVGNPCVVNTETWTPTVQAMQDAVVQTGTVLSYTTQTIDAHRESISKSKWWLQAIVPGLTICFYVWMLVYTLARAHFHIVEPQSLYEILKAAGYQPKEGGDLQPTTEIPPLAPEAP